MTVEAATSAASLVFLTLLEQGFGPQLVPVTPPDVEVLQLINYDP